MSRGYAAKGIRERIRTVRLDEAYRLIRRRHQDRPLGAIPTPSRFSDPLGRYSVLYATQSMRCAVWEGLARDRFARRRRRILAFREVEPIVVVAPEHRAWSLTKLFASRGGWSLTKLA